jgi:hypothetical protein
MFKIEKGIPIPEKKGRRKYPWPQMKVGDSIAIPKKLENSARYSMHYFSKVKTNGKAKFEVRADTIGRNGEVIPLVRIWRVA